MLTLKAWKDYNGVTLENEQGRMFTIDRFYSKCPDYRNKYFTLNCFKYRLEWIK